MDRQGYVRLVEERYFGAMARGDVAGIMTLFAPDATVTTYYGDTPPRRMRTSPRDGEEDLSNFFVMPDFEVSYADFEHIVDVEAQQIASNYTLHIGPRPGSQAENGPARKFRNCNLFALRDGRITKVTIYFANPPTPLERD